MTDSAEKTDVQLKFLLSCLSCNKDAMSIDFHEASRKTGMTLARNTQQKFKKMIEADGRYKLKDGKVMEVGDEDAPGPSTPRPATTSSTRGRGGKTTSARTTTKKRKAADDTDDDDNEEPAPKKSTPAKRGSKKAASKVKNEDDGDGNNDSADAEDDVDEV